MSELWVTNVYNQQGDGAPNFPNGATVTGVVTATTLKGDAEITGGTINAASVTAASGTFNGPVTIGGTLTYEDVTNIDSVGVITAREGIKVTGGGINAVGVITATSFVGSGANLTGIDALPSVSGTASGSITAGNGVMIKSDGNYQAVTGVNETLGAKSTTFSRTYFIKSAFDPTSGKFVIIYGDPANGYYPTSSVATISNTNTVSYGTKTAIEATNIGNVGVDVCYVPNRDKMVCVYRWGGNGMSLESGTISGTDITWGNRLNVTNWAAAESMYQTIAYNPDNNLIAVAYRSGGSGNNAPYLAEFSMDSNGVITAEGNVMLSNNTNEQIDIAYDTANDFYVVAYKNSFQSNQGAITVVTSGNGGNPTTGSGGNYVYYPTGGGTATTGNVIAYDPDTAQSILFYQNTTDDNPYILTAKYTGNGTSNAWTFGTPVQVAADGGCVANSLGITYNSTIKRVVVTWQSSATDKVYARTLEVSGTSFLLQNTVEVDDDYGMYGACSFDTTNHKVLVSYSDDDSNQDSYSSAYVPTNTNLSADTYIGLANNTVTNGQTVKVNTASNISTQSGLTTATKYYVSATGEISTTAASPSVMAGIALNSTQLLIKSA